MAKKLISIQILMISSCLTFGSTIGVPDSDTALLLALYNSQVTAGIGITRILGTSSKTLQLMKKAHDIADSKHQNIVQARYYLERIANIKEELERIRDLREVYSNLSVVNDVGYEGASIASAYRSEIYQKSQKYGEATEKIARNDQRYLDNLSNSLGKLGSSRVKASNMTARASVLAANQLNFMVRMDLLHHQERRLVARLGYLEGKRNEFEFMKFIRILPQDMTFKEYQRGIPIVKKSITREQV